MTLWRAVALILALAWSMAALPMPASASSDDEDLPQCSPDNSRSVSISILNRESEGRDGECVTVTGILWDNAIYGNLSALYRHTSGRTAGYRGVVGIQDYWRRDDSPPRRVAVTGRVVDCALDLKRFRKTSSAVARSMKEGGPIILVHNYGFCRNGKGVALKGASSGEGEKLDLERLMSDEDRKALGDLKPAPADFNFQGRLAELLNLSLQVACNADGAYDSDVTVFDVNTPSGTGRTMLPQAVCDSGTPQSKIFLVDQRTPSADENAEADFLHCMCRGPDCTGKWPIALIDAVEQPSRPYLCHRFTWIPRTISYDADTNKVSEKTNWFFEMSRDAGLYWYEGRQLLGEPS